MDGLAVYLQIACLAGHHDKGQIGTASGGRAFQQTAYFAVEEFGLGTGEIIGDLNKLRDMIAVSDTEIDFVAFVLTKIEELLGSVLHTAEQFYGNDVLQSPTEAFGLKYVIVVGNESWVDGVGFALGLTLNALEGEFGNES